MKLFGDDTVFAAKTTAGVDNYLQNDANIHNRQLQSKRQYDSDVTKEMLDEATKKELQQLYKIRSDTHHTIHISDFIHKFGGHFDTYAYGGGHLDLPKAATEVIAQKRMRLAAKMLRHTEGTLTGSMFEINEEIHVQGPLNLGRAEGGACGAFHFGTCEWLDLAVF